MLLLDEATSSLDSESERQISAALQKVAKGRTTVAVAHRLSTIQHADVIYVLGEGKVLEVGTHAVSIYLTHPNPVKKCLPSFACTLEAFLRMWPYADPPVPLPCLNGRIKLFH